MFLPQSSIAMAAGGEREAQDIARLARGLVAAYERSGRAFSLAGSSVSGSMSGGGAKDWRLRAVMADDSFFSNAADWSFGGPGTAGAATGCFFALCMGRRCYCAASRVVAKCAARCGCERSGRAFSLAGSVSGAAGGGGARDWRLRAVVADDSFFSNAPDWSFGGPGALRRGNISGVVSFNSIAAVRPVN